MDGARYINEYEGAKGSAIAAGAQKGGENRARDRKNDGAETSVSDRKSSAFNR
jgi:hypothetical protein